MSSLTRPTLTAKFVSGARLITLGDSITIGSSDVTATHGEAWPTYASIMSQGRIHLVRNAGVSGNTSAQMLARFSSDVAAYSPNIVTILAGTNDIGTSVSASTWQANIKALVWACQTIGARPVLCTICPTSSNSPAGRAQTVRTWNAWLRRYAALNGIALIDFYSVLADATTGAYQSVYNGDGIHPTNVGHGVMGRLAANVLESITSPNQTLLPYDAADTNNLIPNPLFLNGAGGSVPTSWTPGSAPSGVTLSFVTDAILPGRMFRVACSASSGLYVLTLSAAITAGFSVGDTIAFTGVCTTDGGVTAQAKVTGAACTPMDALSQPFTRGVFYREAVIAPGTTSLQVQLNVGAGTGNVQFGQIGLYNLTTMGALAA